jgi:hypothetical protein
MTSDQRIQPEGMIKEVLAGGIIRKQLLIRGADLLIYMNGEMNGSL